PRSMGYEDRRKADEISGCRRIELAKLFLTRRRSVAIQYRTQASQRRRSPGKKAPQSGNSAGRCVESSKTSFVSSAFWIAWLVSGRIRRSNVKKGSMVEPVSIARQIGSRSFF